MVELTLLSGPGEDDGVPLTARSAASALGMATDSGFGSTVIGSSSFSSESMSITKGTAEGTVEGPEAWISGLIFGDVTWISEVFTGDVTWISGVVTGDLAWISGVFGDGA